MVGSWASAQWATPGCGSNVKVCIVYVLLFACESHPNMVDSFSKPGTHFPAFLLANNAHIIFSSGQWNVRCSLLELMGEKNKTKLESGKENHWRKRLDLSAFYISRPFFCMWVVMSGVVAALLLPQSCKSCTETAQQPNFFFCLIPCSLLLSRMLILWRLQ